MHIKLKKKGSHFGGQKFQEKQWLVHVSTHSNVAYDSKGFSSQSTHTHCQDGKQVNGMTVTALIQLGKKDLSFLPLFVGTIKGYTHWAIMLEYSMYQNQ